MCWLGDKYRMFGGLFVKNLFHFISGRLKVEMKAKSLDAQNTA